MTLADSATTALAVTAILAVVARLAGALTTGGAVAGAIVGACVSVGFGLPGLAVLGTFFVVGTLATRIGWATKKARGTAEAGEGRRDWKRVLGKGGVAAAAGLLMSGGTSHDPRLLFVGSVAAALADTLGTEIGTLWIGLARTVPLLRPVPGGTAGAVSLLGTGAATIGAVVVAIVAWLVRVWDADDYADPALIPLMVAVGGLGASLLESFAVGLGLRAPGFVRNLLTTAAGALLTTGLCAIWAF